MTAIAIFQVLLFAIVGHALLQPRTYAQIQGDLRTIVGDENNVTAGIFGFNEGFPFPGLTLQSDISKLEQDLSTCTTDAHHTSALTTSQAQNVVRYLNGTFYNTTRQMLTAFTERKSQFAAAGLSSTIAADLETIKNDTDSCFLAIGSTAPTPQKKQVSQIESSINALYASAIAVYNA